MCDQYASRYKKDQKNKKWDHSQVFLESHNPGGTVVINFFSLVLFCDLCVCLGVTEKFWWVGIYDENEEGNQLYQVSTILYNHILHLYFIILSCVYILNYTILSIQNQSTMYHFIIILLCRVTRENLS